MTADRGSVATGWTNGQRGNILITMAVLLPALLGVTALAIDAGYLFDYRQRMSAAADAAAIAGAFEIKRDSAISTSTLQQYARDDAARNGFSDGANGVSVTVRRCSDVSATCSGALSGNAKYVEVIIQQSVPTFFMRILGTSAMSVAARAVAGPEDATGCVYALSTQDTNKNYTTELNVSGKGVSLNVPNCGIVSNGDFAVAAGNTVKASQIAVTAATGTISGTVTCTGGSPCPSYSVPASSDPFGDLDEASLFGTSWTCGWTARRNKGGVITNLSGSANFINGTPSSQDTKASYTLNPGVYCGDGGTQAITITLTNDPMYSVTFSPGVYIINGGGLNWKHSYVYGSGVTLYLTGTTTTHDYTSCGGKIFDTDAPLTLQLSAPTSGSYAGLLFVQDRSQARSCVKPPLGTGASDNAVQANIVPASMNLDGAIYFPNHHIKYGATTVNSGTYTVLIGGTLEFANSATLNSDFVGGGLTGNPATRPGLGE